MFKKKEPKFKFDCGDRVQDIVTGFEGIVMHRTQWLTNCNTYGIKPPKLDKNGIPIDSESFDEPRLKIVRAKVVELPAKKTGGPCDKVGRTNRI